DVLVVSANGDLGLSRLLGEGLTERLSRSRTGLVRIRRHAGGEEVLGEAVRPHLETLRKSVSRRSADQLRFILDLGSVKKVGLPGEDPGGLLQEAASEGVTRLISGLLASLSDSTPVVTNV